MYYYVYESPDGIFFKEELLTIGELGSETELLGRYDITSLNRDTLPVEKLLELIAG